MSKPTIRIYTGDGEFIDREMNDQEYNQYLIDQEGAAADKLAKEAKATQRQALLNRLGLTEEEAKILLSS